MGWSDWQIHRPSSQLRNPRLGWVKLFEARFKYSTRQSLMLSNSWTSLPSDIHAYEMLGRKESIHISM